MKTVIKWIVWIAVAVIVVFAGGGYLLPGEAVVQRQAIVAAPPEKVFAIIGNMQRFNEWSPWAEIDPAAKYTFEGPATGAGQKMRWTSANPDVGNGSQTIVEYELNRRTVTELELGGMGKARASMEISAILDGTAVTWGFKTELNGALDRWFGLMFDRWIGADYEKGLAKLKALAEKNRAVSDSDRVALVTGGAQGIGFAAARRFLADGFAGVVLLDRNSDGLERGRKELTVLGSVETVLGDLRDEALPARAVAKTVERFGRLDVLVNAAGSTERCGLDDTTPEAFDRLFGVNVKAPLFMMQEAVKVMRKAGAGVIVNVSSMLAHGGPPNLVTYSATKAALVTLTRAAANAVKRDGIRIFAINLGWTHTEGEQALQTSFHGLPENWAEEIGRRMPAGRLIQPDDVAGLCAFLVSPPAQMMTGAVIDYEQMPAGTFDAHPALAPE